MIPTLVSVILNTFEDSDLRETKNILHVRAIVVLTNYISSNYLLEEEFVNHVSGLLSHEDKVKLLNAQIGEKLAMLS